MKMDITSIIMLIIGIPVGALLWSMYKTIAYKEKMERARKDLENAKTQAEKILKESQLKSQENILEGKKATEEQKNELLKEFKEREKRLNKREEQLALRDELYLAKEKEFKVIEKRQKDTETLLETQKESVQNEMKKVTTELEKIAGMSQEEAKEKLIQKIEDEAKHIATKKIKAIEDALAEDAEKMSKEIISTAIQRYSGEYVAENTVTTVSLPNDEMKGRIIGREGRNIRAIEAVTGVDLIIDDTPEAVVISDFNPIRRQIASLTLQKLISDGRIHPGRIEEVFEAASKDVWKTIKEAGEQAIFDLGIHKLHPELVLLVGRLRYRTSYSQNVWKHSIETGFLAGLMAAELNYSVKNARRAGLLHDIGKAVDHEIEGSHASIGAKLAEKYGESKRIFNAIAAHHGEIKPESILDVLIAAADALSGARPGARREMSEAYIQRLTELENLATAFEGVDKSFAIQAGRELRVIVDTTKVNDEDAYILANDISKKIEAELSYPGQIKVVVIRETRVVSTAQ
ncbi:MAG TPA: ribonuclease Y [bacterium]|nr:ribonuclease Y [bacterium]HPM46830.1 ribonuclease Y [bacterium]HRQ69264.1 ribonuclease Y [bacterium]